jgi:transcriptional regulator with XRE-family HTH domain
MTRPGDHGELLGELINERRLELGLTWDGVTRRTGVAASAIREVRKGRATLREITAAKLERGLGLAPRSIHRVMTGQATRLPLAAEPTRPARDLPGDVRASMDDPVVREILGSDGISEEAQLGLIAAYLAERDSRNPGRASSTGS